MGKYFDDADDVTKELAKTIMTARGIDNPDLAMVMARAGEGASEIVMGAIQTAQATGKTDDNMQMAARLKVVGGELETLNKKYATAKENNQLRDLVGLKNKISALATEQATLQQAINMSKVAGDG